jgi:hypothetical protein
MVASLLVIRGFSGRQLEEVGRGSADATDQPSPARGTAPRSVILRMPGRPPAPPFSRSADAQPTSSDLENAGPFARTALLKIGERPADLKRS